MAKKDQNINQNPQQVQQVPQATMVQQQGQPMMTPPLPMPQQPGSRRARWNRQLMAGAAMAMKSLPDWFAIYAIATYAVAVIGVNLLYSSYAMEWYFWLFGVMWVVGFFALSVKYSREWSITNFKKAKSIERKLFWTGFAIRAVYVIAIYFFYLEMTGKPYEFQAADSASYIEFAGDWSAIYIAKGKFWAEMSAYSQTHFSDIGYPLFLVLPIHWFGETAAIIITRLIQAALGAYTSVIIYRITRRSMDETTARFAAIFCMLHPVLICYAGMSLKEVLMTFLVVLFIDMAERLLRNRRYTFGTLAPMILVGGSLFMFRTVLGMVAFIAVFFAIVMIDSKIVSWGKKVITGILLAGILALSVSDNIKQEMNRITESDVMAHQKNSMEKRYGDVKDTKIQRNAFAKYAGAAVFAPLIFTIPFPTIVVTQDQEDFRLIHGGNWMRNIMSGFVVLAMFMLLLSGDWRQYTLPLAMLLGYLVMLVFTEFAHSLRFHIPVMPFEMMFAAYAITKMRSRHKRWYLYWCLFTIVTCFAWNWFKLAGRGLA